MMISEAEKESRGKNTSIKAEFSEMKIQKRQQHTNRVLHDRSHIFRKRMTSMTHLASRSILLARIRVTMTALSMSYPHPSTSFILCTPFALHTLHTPGPAFKVFIGMTTS